MRRVWEYPLDEWRKVIDINLNALFYCNRAVVPHMREKNYGRIVNIASIAGKEGNPDRLRLQRFEGRGDRAHEIARQGTGEDRDHRQRDHAGGRPDRDLRPDHAGAHRLHAVEDPDGAVRQGRRRSPRSWRGWRARNARSPPARCSTSPEAAPTYLSAARPPATAPCPSSRRRSRRASG